MASRTYFPPLILFILLFMMLKKYGYGLLIRSTLVFTVYWLCLQHLQYSTFCLQHSTLILPLMQLQKVSVTLCLCDTAGSNSVVKRSVLSVFIDCVMQSVSVYTMDFVLLTNKQKIFKNLKLIAQWSFSCVLVAKMDMGIGHGFKSRGFSALWWILIL